METTTNQVVALTILATVTAVGVLTLVAVYLMMGMASQDYGTRAGSSGKPEGHKPAARLLLWRALARKCPSCGHGAVLKSYFEMNQACSSCDAVFWKNEGEWTGAMLIDFVLALGGALYSWGALVYFDFSEWMQVLVPCLIAVGVGVLVIPLSRSFWTVFLYITGEGALAAKDD